MKELSIEEKAKAYDEALKVLHKYDGANIMFTQDLKEEMFPELREPEDEKIRKSIIAIINNYVDNSNTFKPKMIAWLEKQYADPIKEYWRGYNEGKQNILDKYAELEKQAKQPKQDNSDVNDYNNIDPHFGKPIDKIEPKFHEGDWAVSNLDGKTRQISEVHFDEYNSYYVVDGKSVNLEEYDRLHHLWTIQDAKDGDVLFMDNGSANCIFIYKSSNNGIINKYASYNKFGFEGEHYLVLNDGYVIPATKEQRGLLFQKMHEAGYEWDTEKKELILFRVNKCC